jgi:hypothetical protein
MPLCPACFVEMGLANFLLELALNCDPPHICLWSSWDHRHEPQPYKSNFKKKKKNPKNPPS